MKRSTLVLMLLLASLLPFGLQGCSDGDDGDDGEQGEQGPPGPPGPGGEPTTSVETCIGCHGDMAVRPVGDLEDPDDVHGMGVSPLETLVVNITEVDVTSTSVGIEFEAETEMGAPVDILLASDGRFTIARLEPGMNGDPDVWVPFITRIENPSIGPGVDPKTQGNAERFTSGSFTNNMDGSYSYVSSFDPTSVPIMDGDTLRVAIQIDDDPPFLATGNGWCDFDADTSSANDCVAGPAPTLTRDIVQTATCNGCHGVTPDVRLALHGGGRIAVEYCVTCHNPTTSDADSGNPVNMPVLIHKIHYGAELENGYMIYGFNDNLHDYSTVEFTKEIDDCTNCHTGGGADEDNWSLVPNREACGSCHDHVDFDTGANHQAGAQPTNQFCATAGCHPQVGPWTPGSAPAPIETVHMGVARRMEGARYAGGINGYQINDVDLVGDDLVIDWEVVRDGTAMDVENAPEFNAGGASTLRFVVGWSSDDYFNTGTGAEPASAFRIDALDFAGTTVALGGNEFRSTAELPGDAEGTIGIGMEGHPAADLGGDGIFSDRIAVKNAVAFFDVEGSRAGASPRRQIVDVNKCNQCHDSSGNGISLHGQNRTGEIQVCAICHNGNNTDINRRPDDPMDALDGKKEQAIDFGRMIHQIHSGAELEEGVVIYGFGGSVHDFGTVEFIGNRRNCETCHLPADTMGSERNYGALAASDRLPTTIDTGPSSTPSAPDDDPDDDLNISPTAAICSSCHDSEAAKDHMKLHGASFQALDDDIL